MRIVRAACVGALLVVLVVLAGCGGESMGQVSGTVKVDGEPLKTGAITFIPVDGKTQTAGGNIEAGRYSVKKVPVTVMKIEIRAPKVIGTKKLYPTPDSETRPLTAEVLPARYNDQTELKLDVKSGTNVKDWDLKTK
jgi:hypothetical protein